MSQIAGRRTMARASPTRCWSPPESSRGFFCSSSVSPSRRAMVATAAARSAFAMPPHASGKAMFSATERWG